MKRHFSAPRNLAQVDRDTGEIVEGVFAIMPVRKRNGFSEGWFAMSNEALAQILTLTTNRQLQLRDLEVLFAMLEVLELENFLRVSQKSLAERLGMLQPHVSRSIGVLLKHGILLAGPKIGTSSTYRLNPRFGWKGSGKAHQTFGHATPVHQFAHQHEERHGQERKGVDAVDHLLGNDHQRDQTARGGLHQQIGEAGHPHGDADVHPQEHEQEHDSEEQREHGYPALPACRISATVSLRPTSA